MTTPRTRKRRSPYKVETSTSDVESCISDAASDVGELKDEIETWRDNMSGTALENTTKFEAVEDCLSTLEDLVDNLERIDTGVLDGLPLPVVTYHVMVPRSKRKSPSRATRLSNAESMVSAAIETLRDYLSELEEADTHSEANEDARDALESLIDELDALEWSIDFPGMY